MTQVVDIGKQIPVEIVFNKYSLFCLGIQCTGEYV